MTNWNIDELMQVPEYRTIYTDGNIRGIIYENEPYKGKKTEVFAYLGVPDTGNGKLPAMVCVHGGGGRAFREWVELWNKRGFAAISMDFGGMGMDGEPLEFAGPNQDHPAKFELKKLGWKNIWTYHAIAAIMRSYSILASQPQVDENRIGIVGISWGGFLTCIASGVDPRLKCSIPIYGCGFIRDNSAAAWVEIFAEMDDDERNEWHRLCDPSQYLPDSKIPMLFVNGTNDFAYHLNCYQKSYELPQGPVKLCIRHEMSHGHQPGWDARESYYFAESILNNGVPLPEISAMNISGNTCSAEFSSQTEITRGLLLHTVDSGWWPDRKWIESKAELSGNTVSAKIPPDATCFYLAVEDNRNLQVSAPHQT